MSQGDSLKEALENIREAILLCLEVRKDQGVPPPAETPEVVAEEIRPKSRIEGQVGLPELVTYGFRPGATFASMLHALVMQKLHR